MVTLQMDNRVENVGGVHSATPSKATWRTCPSFPYSISSFESLLVFMTSRPPHPHCLFIGQTYILNGSRYRSKVCSQRLSFPPNKQVVFISHSLWQNAPILTYIKGSSCNLTSGILSFTEQKYMVNYLGQDNFSM